MAISSDGASINESFVASWSVNASVIHYVNALFFGVAAWARGCEPFDNTGLKDYVAECERLGTVPVTYFLRHSREKTFSMKYHGLGPLGTKAIAKALEVSRVKPPRRYD